jgi:NAD-dependent dihydropyrimidine dehydrogenase PreA subunit
MQITIAHDRCPNPLECARCLRACPALVFNALPSRVEKFRETAPQDYFIEATYHPACTGCLACVEVCPQAAISVTVP